MATTKLTTKAMAAVRSCFGDSASWSIQGTDSVTIDIENADESAVAFADLQRLSEAFGTSMINVTTANGGGGCDTCGWGATVDVEIACRDCTRGLEARTYSPGGSA
jgi:hypothetical protein